MEGYGILHYVYKPIITHQTSLPAPMPSVVTNYCKMHADQEVCICRAQLKTYFNKRLEL